MLVAVSVDMEGASQLRSVRAMSAALVPFMPYWLGGFDSAADAAAADHERVAELRLIFDAWAEESHPQWYSDATDPLPGGVAGAVSPRQVAYYLFNVVNADAAPPPAPRAGR